MTAPTPPPIGPAERRARLDALRALMESDGLAAVLLGATESLRYFTGLVWTPSERLTGAVVSASGGLAYLCPRFERDRVEQAIGIAGEILTWEEHEDPARLVADLLGPVGRLGIDDQIPLFIYHNLVRAIPVERLADAGRPINRLRRCKSPAELALLARAKAITLAVQERAWRGLEAGMRRSDLVRLIDAAHRTLGAPDGSSFCLVSFGTDTALPHGGTADRVLQAGDVVLVDTGCRIDGYHSDITRTYVFGDPTPQFRAIWQLELAAQQAAFQAARPGVPCEAVDAAARACLAAAGLGPDYRLPGLPHRTGHGIGLDIHEAPHLVRGETTALAPGMCFSNEPMIVLPGQFGVRLEDHFYLTASGPRWFTPPAATLEAPFANAPSFP